MMLVFTVTGLLGAVNGCLFAASGPPGQRDGPSRACGPSVLHLAAGVCQPVQVLKFMELHAVGRQLKPYRWRPRGVTWDVVPEQSW